MSKMKSINLNNKGMVNGMSFDERTSIGTFLSEAMKYKPLTRDEEIETAKAVQNGDEKAFVKMCNHNLLLVIKCAKAYMHNGLSLADLIGYGNIGLMNAVKGYTKYMEFRFSSYGLHYIRKAIIDAIEKYGGTLKNTHANANLNLRIKKFSEQFEKTYGMKPDIYDIADELGESVEDIRRAMESKKNIVSMDSVLNDEDNCTIGDMVAGTLDADTEIKKQDTKKMVEIALSILSEREKTIVKMSFGIEDGIEYSTEIIGGRLGLCEERVKQILKTSIKKMQASAK